MGTPNTFADWPLLCPTCHGPLQSAATTLDCATCQTSYPVHDGVAALMDFDARPEMRDFTESYQSIRRAEGYTGRGSAYYRALPDHPANDPDSAIWRIRQRSFARFKAILARTVPPGGRVLDLGSGNGWLSHHMAILGYRPMGMDINADPDDGLAALRHYPVQWPAVLTSFDQLPLSDASADMAVFNGSLHYSPSIADTLEESFRVLKPGGTVVIMDSPIYRDPTSGAAMMEERRQHHLATFGQATEMDTAGYLSWAEVDTWSARFACRLTVERPWYGLGWALRPAKARLLGTREPATFALIVLTANDRT